MRSELDYSRKFFFQFYTSLINLFEVEADIYKAYIYILTNYIVSLDW